MAVNDGNTLLPLISGPAPGVLGAAHGILPGRDGHLHFRQFIAGIRAGLAHHQVLQQGLGIFRIEDRKTGVIAQVLVLLADHVQPEVMEGGNNQSPGQFAIHQASDTFFHFARGLVGEGNGGDMTPWNAKVFDQISHFAGDHAGLTAAGTSQYQHRTLRVADGFTLSGVELVHNNCANPGNSEITWEANILH